MTLGKASRQVLHKYYNDYATRANEHLQGGSIIGHTLSSDAQRAPVAGSFFLWGGMGGRSRELSAGGR